MSTWKFERMKGFAERAAILGQLIAEHDGYYRDNNGDWIVGDGEGRVASVRFCGTAKRGQGYNAPDPEGMRRARLIAAAPQMLEALKAFDAAAEDAECNEGLVAGENIAEISYEIDANLFIKVLREVRAAIKLAEGE